jgi:SSS family solute:Na+ symporter
VFSSFQQQLLLFLFCYLSSFPLIGWLASKKLHLKTNKDYFLAGNRLGPLVLIFTLFATQYSGVTLVGFVGKSYRVGLSWAIFSLALMTVIVGYLIYAPKLKQISEKHAFITPVDYLRHRYQCPMLTKLCSLIMIYALANYLITQLIVIGRMGEAMAPSNYGYSWYIGAIIFLSLIMLIYESIGGMLAVAWTDMVQGAMILLCLYATLFLVSHHYGGLSSILSTIQNSNTLNPLMSPPNGATCRSWFSYIVVLGLGASVYPQAIQRIFASRSMQSLKQSFLVMVWLPIIMAIPVILLGLSGAVIVPQLSTTQSEQLIPLMLAKTMQTSLVAKFILMIFFAAVISAVMSTADSVLLSLSSIIIKELLPSESTHHSKNHLIKSKLTTIIILCLFILFAIGLRNTTIIQMIDIKLDMLVQLVPVFYLGVNSKSLSGQSLLWGLGSSLFLIFIGAGLGFGKIASIHIGTYGLLLNFMAIGLHHRYKVHHPF